MCRRRGRAGRCRRRPAAGAEPGAGASRRPCQPAPRQGVWVLPVAGGTEGADPPRPGSDRRGRRPAPQDARALLRRMDGPPPVSWRRRDLAGATRPGDRGGGMCSRRRMAAGGRCRRRHGGGRRGRGRVAAGCRRRCRGDDPLRASDPGDGACRPCPWRCRRPCRAVLPWRRRQRTLPNRGRHHAAGRRLRPSPRRTPDARGAAWVLRLGPPRG